LSNNKKRITTKWQIKVIHSGTHEEPHNRSDLLPEKQSFNHDQSGSRTHKTSTATGIFQQKLPHMTKKPRADLLGKKPDKSLDTHTLR